MHRPFQPLVRNAHLLTIAANFWPRDIDETRFPPRRRVYHTDANTGILVLEHQPLEAQGQILLLHGLEGSSNAGYFKSFAQDALLRGFGIHRSNMRTCGGTETLSETMYHSGLTSDTRFILEQIHRTRPGPLFLLGFSLGGNVALKLAGELGVNNLLTGVCAVSTPIDLAACVRTLDRPSNRIYARRFLKRLKERIRLKTRLSPHLYSDEDLDAVTGIWEFDDRYTGPLFGFGNAENYYRTQSSRNFLDAIRTPSLVIHAKDDPLVPVSTYQHHAFAENPYLKLLLLEHGGHLGFLSREKPRFWLDGVVLDWMEQAIRGGAVQAAVEVRNKTSVGNVV
ncbi:MAG TPA: alpha/beta fold hydrolase [Bryobacteraceae bacterium]|nr:alpha/beta fold hydrolase [Bryobacteraceae bacterium]